MNISLWIQSHNSRLSPQCPHMHIYVGEWACVCYRSSNHNRREKGKECMVPCLKFVWKVNLNSILNVSNSGMVHSCVFSPEKYWLPVNLLCGLLLAHCILVNKGNIFTAWSTWIFCLTYYPFSSFSPAVWHHLPLPHGNHQENRGKWSYAVLPVVFWGSRIRHHWTHEFWIMPWSVSIQK